MTLTKAIEATREALKNAIALADREIARYPIDKYAIGTRHDARQAIADLPDKPKSESEILKIISLAIYNSPDDGEAHHVLRALTKANVLYVEED